MPMWLLLGLACSQTVPVNGASGKITGQWDFDQADLRATVGKNLEYGDGPTGRMKDHTSFGTTTSFWNP